MNLSTDQQRAVEQGQAVPFVLEGTECIIVRKDVYERVKRVIDEEALDADLVYDLIASTAAEDDANDPGLQLYQQYKR